MSKRVFYFKRRRKYFIIASFRHSANVSKRCLWSKIPIKALFSILSIIHFRKYMKRKEKKKNIKGIFQNLKNSFHSNALKLLSCNTLQKQFKIPPESKHQSISVFSLKGYVKVSQSSCECFERMLPERCSLDILSTSKQTYFTNCLFMTFFPMYPH